MHHELKLEEKYWKRIIEGQKRFEIRKDDRDFQIGDTVSFVHPWQEIAWGDNGEGGFRITYVLRHSDFPDGLVPGYCVFGIEEF